MMDKNFFIGFIILVILIFPRSGYSQFCPNAVVPPTTINNIYVTATATGSATTYLPAFTSCGTYTTPTNSIYLGQSGPFTYTMSFSVPINNLDIVLSATGGGLNEDFIFTTNTGIPSIVDHGSCYTTIVSNVILSGAGAQQSGGGGSFTIVNANPFTTLTISGAGGRNGSLLAICSSSIVPDDNIIEICTGDSVLIGGQYIKETGFYSDTIFGGSSTGGDSVITTQLLVNPIPSIDLGYDTTLCLGETITLDATTSNATYLWQDNSTNPTFNAAQQGTYWVMVSVNDCYKIDTIFLKMYDCEIILEIPNVFTPNNDGLNDFFVPEISNGVVSMHTLIYNRWGSKVYETNNLMIEWNGQDVADGTYFWIVYYTDSNGVKNHLKGTLTISR